jgi:hypothetical protein
MLHHDRLPGAGTPHAIRGGLGKIIPGELNLTDDEMVLVGARGLKPPAPTSLSRSRGDFRFG